MNRHKLIHIIDFLHREGIKKKDIAQLIGFHQTDIQHLKMRATFREDRIEKALSILENEPPKLIQQKYGQNYKKILDSYLKETSYKVIDTHNVKLTLPKGNYYLVGWEDFEEKQLGLTKIRIYSEKHHIKAKAQSFWTIFEQGHLRVLNNCFYIELCNTNMILSICGSLPITNQIDAILYKNFIHCNYLSIANESKLPVVGQCLLFRTEQNYKDINVEIFGLNSPICTRIEQNNNISFIEELPNIYILGKCN